MLGRSESRNGCRHERYVYEETDFAHMNPKSAFASGWMGSECLLPPHTHLTRPLWKGHRREHILVNVSVT